MQALDLVFSLVLTFVVMMFIAAATSDALRAAAMKQSIYRAVINRANATVHYAMSWPTLAMLGMATAFGLSYTEALSGYGAAGAGLFAFAVPHGLACKALDYMREVQDGIKPDSDPDE